MRFDVVTLFPELFAPFLESGITRRAFERKLLDVRLWPLRDYAEGAYRRVDDRPFGGGPGMVMLAEPLERALHAIRAAREVEAEAGAGALADGGADTGNGVEADAGAGSVDAGVRDARAPVVLFTPTGRRIDQSLVRAWSTGPGAILVCGRYEGVDQRVVDRHVDLELSLGDFVLSGGELPAMALLDAVARLQPGVLGDEQSHLQDSFEDGLLDCPHYSRPEVLGTVDGPLPVPPVLLSGHHAAIARWRRERSLALTAARRPDLIEAARAAGRLDAADEQFLAALPAGGL